MTYTPQATTSSSVKYQLRILGVVDGFSVKLNTDLGVIIDLEQTGDGPTNHAAAIAAADERFQELVDIIDASPGFSASGTKILTAKDTVAADEEI